MHAERQHPTSDELRCWRRRRRCQESHQPCDLMLKWPFRFLSLSIHTFFCFGLSFFISRTNDKWCFRSWYDRGDDDGDDSILCAMTKKMRWWMGANLYRRVRPPKEKRMNKLKNVKCKRHTLSNCTEHTLPAVAMTYVTACIIGLMKSLRSPLASYVVSSSMHHEPHRNSIDSIRWNGFPARLSSVTSHTKHWLISYFIEALGCTWKL